MIKKALSVTGTRVAGTAAQGLTFLILTQALGPVAFGVFVAITVAFGLVSSVIEFGTGTLALRVQSVDQPKSLAASISVIRYCTLIFTAIPIIGIAMLLFDVEAALFLSGLLFGAVEASYRPIENLLFGFNRHARAQISMIVRRFAVLAAAFTGYFLESTPLILNIALTVLLAASPLWLIGLLSKPLSLSSTVRLSLPYWGATMLSKLQTLDVLIASIFISPVGAGVYAAASRITSPLNILASSVLSVLTPELSKQGVADRLRTYRKSAKMLAIVSSLLILFSPVVGWLLEWVLGPQYTGVALPAAVLCVSTGLAAFNQGQVSYLYASGEARKLFFVRLATVPVSMLSCIPLGIAFDSVGVATGVCLSQLLQVVILRWHFLRIQKNNDAHVPPLEAHSQSKG